MTRTLCLPPDLSGASVMRQPATAIILAGGKSTRMGRDKALLPFQGRPMIEHVILQLCPHFEQILVSANDTAKYAFLNATIVPDQFPDHGPLMGIASCLEVSKHERNFFVACDMPTIDIGFVKELLHLSTNYDCVVPVNAQGQVEPLLAVYKKSALESIWATLATGECAVRKAFTRCKTRYIQLGNTDTVENINTKEDYQQLLARQWPRVNAMDSSTRCFGMEWLSPTRSLARRVDARTDPGT